MVDRIIRPRPEHRAAAAASSGRCAPAAPALVIRLWHTAEHCRPNRQMSTQL